MRLGFMPIKSVFTIVLFFISFSFSFANSKIDSLRVEKEGDQSFIIHEVEPKETLFGISRRYQSPVGDIIKSNAALKEGLKIGQTIKVPFIPQAAIPEGAGLHNVVPGETLFSISKKYDVTVEDLKMWNDLLGNDLSIGQSLIIKGVVPVKKETEIKTPVQVTEVKKEEAKQEVLIAKGGEEIKEKPKQKELKKEEGTLVKKEVESDQAPKQEPLRSPNEELTSTNGDSPMVPGDWMSHTVVSGETLFSIASRYNARVEDLITWNALSSNNLKDGQLLKVGRGPAEASNVPVYGSSRVVSSVEEMNKELENTASSGGFKNINENGQAELIEGTGGHKKYLVLHRTAPVGTIMRIKNEENDVTIFARVVGVLPETGDNEKLIIKLSQAAFDQLKAVNGRFPVEIMY